MTRHAEDRRAEHGFTLEDIELSMTEPEVAHPAGPLWPDRRVYIRGPIKTIASLDGVVITVMPSPHATSYQRWEHNPAA